MNSRTRFVAAGVAVVALVFLGAAAASVLSPTAKPPGPPGRTQTDTGTTATTDTATTSTASPTAGPTTVSTLYAASGNGCSASSLYTLDSGTGAATKVADIKIGGTTQVTGISGLAFDPTTDVLYAFANGGAYNCGTFGHGTLMTVDKSTGSATVIGSQGGSLLQASSIAFDRKGNLYAFSGGCNEAACVNPAADLYSLDTSTGAATKVGECGCVGFGTGLAVDSTGRMYMKDYQTLWRANAITGHVFSPVQLSGGGGHAVLSFGPSDTLWTGDHGCSGCTPYFQLQTLNPATGAVTNVGSSLSLNISGIAWDLGTSTAPDQADLSLDVGVDNAAPTAETGATFTLTVSNGGPSSATGVVVKDLLPSGFTWVSDTGSGSYDHTTGMWTIGTITNGSSATLDVTATVHATGIHTNAAEVVAAGTYDPDSTPGSGEGDTFASSRSAPSGTPALYAASGAYEQTWGCPNGANMVGGWPGSLYELDPSTGAATEVANITIGGDPVNGLTGLAFDPTTGDLYGMLSGDAGSCSTLGAGTLIQIDKETGVATAVGSTGDAAIQAADLTFDPAGNAYAWGYYNDADAHTDDLYSVDTTLGTTSDVGDCGCSTSNNPPGTGLAADSLGRMYLKRQGDLSRVDQFTGTLYSTVGLSSGPTGSDMLAFGPNDELYSGFRIGAPYNTPAGFQLNTIDPSDGTVTTVGTDSALEISALAWDLGTTSVNIADLSLTKEADISSPDNWFTDITFTLTVSNAGPDSATGVQVFDPIPSGFTYVSNNPSQGAYNTSTHIWDVGTIANGADATLDLVLRIQPTGNWTNTAEVVDSTSYDPDSVPASTHGDTIDSKQITPTAVQGKDVAAAVILSGQATRATATSKGFNVKLTNVGTVDAFVDQSMLAVDVLKNNVSTGQASCKAFSATLKPGRSVRAHCTFNIAAANLAPGNTVKYTATIDVPGDGFTNNDSDVQSQPVT